MKKGHSQIFREHLWNVILTSNSENLLDDIVYIIKKGGYRKRVRLNKLKPLNIDVPPKKSRKNPLT